MKTLLKYLIPLLMAAAFLGGGEMPSSVPVGSDESVANVVICCFIQNKSITTLSSRTEPANLLLSLGRLII